MSTRTRAVLTVVLAGAAAAAAALLLPPAEGEPLAYPGSRPGVGFRDAQRLALVTLPHRLRPRARYHVEATGGAVAMDFIAADRDVERFLVALGVDTARPPAVWVAGRDTPPLTPPAGSGARWRFAAGQRVETWRAEVGVGADRRQVTVVVNRSTNRVCLRAVPAGQPKAATSPVAAARARHRGE